MIQSALNTHPGIICEEELFHEKYTRRKPPQKARDFLEAVLFNRHAAAIGFKLQGYQATDEINQLLRDDGFRVILPYRRDKLDQYVSFLVAQQTDRWQRHAEDEYPVVKVRVDPQAFEDFVKGNDDKEADIRKTVEGLPTISVFYEDCLTDWNAQMGRIQDFLGVKSLQLKPTTFKARTRPLKDWVENWDELPYIGREAFGHEGEIEAEHHRGKPETALAKAHGSLRTG